MTNRYILLTAIALTAGQGALAQSPEYMQQDCANSTQIFFQDFEAKTEMTYEGQRSDGTHAVNGTIYLETRSADAQCSYNAAGDTLVGFVAEGQSWESWVSGGPSPYQSGGGASATSGGTDSAGPAASDNAQQVRFDPGASSAVLTRTLEAGGAFQFVLGAREGQFLRVRVVPHSGEMYYIIRNPDGSILLDGTDTATEYYGQLWQSGDHVVEVVSQMSEPLTYDISFEIK